MEGVGLQEEGSGRKGEGDVECLCGRRNGIEGGGSMKEREGGR